MCRVTHGSPSQERTHGPPTRRDAERQNGASVPSLVRTTTRSGCVGNLRRPHGVLDHPGIRRPESATRWRRPGREGRRGVGSGSSVPRLDHGAAAWTSRARSDIWECKSFSICIESCRRSMAAPCRPWPSRPSSHACLMLVLAPGRLPGDEPDGGIPVSTRRPPWLAALAEAGTAERGAAGAESLQVIRDLRLPRAVIAPHGGRGGSASPGCCCSRWCRNADRRAGHPWASTPARPWPDRLVASVRLRRSAALAGLSLARRASGALAAAQAGLTPSATAAGPMSPARTVLTGFTLSGAWG